MTLDRRALIVSGMAAAAMPTLARAAPLPAQPGDHVLGQAKAKVQIVEYASMSCGHCAHAALKVMPAIKKRYIDTGKARLVFREFLTPPYDLAGAGFLLANRVAPARYFEAIDAIFAAQEGMYKTGDYWGGLLAVAKRFGLTEPQLEAALSDKAALAALNARVEAAGKRDKIEGTPTFFVDGAQLVGDVTIDDLAQAIEKALKA